jgi:NitT/TauT family transport system permease protein
MGRKQLFDRILSPVTYILYPIPKTALLPVLLLLFGIGNLSKILLLLLVLFFQVLLNLRDGATRINEEYLLSVRSLGATQFQRFRFVIFPAVLPRLLTSLRTGSGTALSVLFFAETFFTEYGLGFYIMDSWVRVSYTEMFSGILCISLLGLALFLGIDAIEHRFCAWKE